MKIVVEITEADGSPYRDPDYLKASVPKMTNDGYLEIVSKHWSFDIMVVGVVTAEDCPGDQKIMAVEPLDDV